MAGLLSRVRTLALISLATASPALAEPAGVIPYRGYGTAVGNTIDTRDATTRNRLAGLAPATSSPEGVGRLDPVTANPEPNTTGLYDIPRVPGTYPNFINPQSRNYNRPISHNYVRPVNPNPGRAGITSAGNYSSRSFGMSIGKGGVSVNAAASSGNYVKTSR